jgi:hypothetical protein
MHKTWVGYIALTDVPDSNTYEIVSAAKRKEPDREAVDNVIKQPIRQPMQGELRAFLDEGKQAPTALPILHACIIKEGSLSSWQFILR